MGKQVPKETDRFTAFTEDGNLVAIVEYTDFTEVRPGGGKPPERVEGQKVYRTANGEKVNRKDANTFEILGSLQSYVVKRR